MKRIKEFERRSRGGFTLVELLIVILIIAILAGMMLEASGSAVDSAEATKIINDLRDLKSAGILFFVDEGRWPTAAEANGNSFDKYVDRHVQGTVLRASPIIGGVQRELIGLELPAEKSNGGIINKLKLKATDAAIVTATGAHYDGADADVYMHMK